MRAGIATAIAALVLAAPAVAGAQDGAATPSEQIVLSGRLVVGPDEVVDSAVIFNGPATVAGRVTESLVVFNGDVEITGTVDGDVVAFNGDVVVRDGATIGRNLVTVDDPVVEPGATVRGEQQTIRRFDTAWFGVAGRLVWWIGYSISALILGFVLLGVAPRLDAGLAAAARDRLGASFGLGALAFFGLPIVAALLVAIVVAIPLGLFLFLGLALLYTIGYAAGAHVLGRRLVREPRSRFVAFLAGWAILRALALIPIIGGLAWATATIVGLGALWVASRSRAATAPPEAEPVPAMPPLPDTP